MCKLLITIELIIDLTPEWSRRYIANGIPLTAGMRTEIPQQEYRQLNLAYKYSPKK